MICGKTNLDPKDGGYFILLGTTPAAGITPSHSRRSSALCLLLVNMYTEGLEGDTDGLADQMSRWHEAGEDARIQKGPVSQEWFIGAAGRSYTVDCLHPQNKY